MPNFLPLSTKIRLQNGGLKIEWLFVQLQIKGIMIMQKYFVFIFFRQMINV